jgi:hypothetical protein
MPKQTPADKAIDVRIDKLYRVNFQGVQINIMAIPKLFDAARAVILAGGDDTAVLACMTQFITTPRT